MVRRIIAYVFALFLAAGIQSAFLAKYPIWGAHADLVLIVIIVGGLLTKTEGALILGFSGGLLEGSLIGISIPSFIISRTIMAFFAGVLETRLFRENPLVSIIAVFIGTLIAEIIFLLFNPPPAILDQFRVIGLEAVMNCILAPFVFLLLHRVTWDEHGIN